MSNLSIAVIVTMSSLRLYEDPWHAELYAKFRPSYPQKIMDMISHFATKHGIHLEAGLALDIACGSGQGTFPLAHLTKKCIGVDNSRAQINCANEKKASAKRDNIEFVVADAHSLPFEEDHFDLVTCATAWHWLDPKAACSEVSRVLKKPGCLAVYAYPYFDLSHPVCNEHLQKFFRQLDEVSIPRPMVMENHYRDAELPFPVLERHDMTVPMNFKISELTGFLQSLSAYKNFCEKYQANTLIDDLAEALKKAVTEDATLQVDGVEDPTLEASIPMFLLLCIKD